MKNVKYIFSSVNYPEKKFARKFLIFTHRQLQTLTTLLGKKTKIMQNFETLQSRM